jgi:hypothetical protein
MAEPLLKTNVKSIIIDSKEVSKGESICNSNSDCICDLNNIYCITQQLYYGNTKCTNSISEYLECAEPASTAVLIVPKSLLGMDEPSVKDERAVQPSPKV